MARPKKKVYGEVTEADFHRPEFKDARPEDYEYLPTGELARKDRWEQGIKEISSILGIGKFNTIEAVVTAVKAFVAAVPGSGNHLFIAPDVVVWNVAVQMTKEKLDRIWVALGRKDTIVVVVPNEAVVREHIHPLINTSDSPSYFAEFGPHFRFMLQKSISDK